MELAIPQLSWAQKNVERAREWRKKYVAKNHDRILSVRNEYYRKNADRINERRRNYLKTHPEKNYLKVVRDAIFKVLGYKCIRCGFTDMRALQIDHINGNGAEKQRLAKSLYGYTKTILEELQNGSVEYQILCANCNWIKRYENQELVGRTPKKY